MAQYVPAGAAAEDRVAVRLAHLTDGRARLCLAHAADRAAMPALVDRLAALPGVTRVVARPNTGSIIVEAEHDAPALGAALAGAAALRLLDPEPSIRVGPAAQLGIARLDRAIRARTDQAMDLRSALAVVLAAGAAVQLVRGRVAGPATTLLLAALSMVGGPPGR